MDFWLFSRIIEPLYGMPGASLIGMLTTYFSDNPAILTFAKNRQIRKYFKKYQLPALTNLGTCFGMGMVVTAVLAGVKSPVGENFGPSVLIGNIGAIIGGLVSTRIMLLFTAKIYGKTEPCSMDGYDGDDDFDIMKYQKTREGGAAISLVPNLISSGLANAHDMAVFCAMCMCWSGYLSTHVAMMDQLGERKLTGKAILAHTIGGICAGFAANILYTLFIH